MQKGQTLIFLLIGIVIVTVAGGAFYLGRSTTPKSSSTPAATSQTPQPTPAQTSADETANWKIYQDSETGIEFKYPESWFAKKLPNWTFQIFLEKHPIVVPEASEFMTSIEVRFNEAMNTETNQKFFSEKTLEAGVERTKDLYDPTTRKISSLTVGGKRAVQISGNWGPGPLEGQYFSFTLVQLDNKLLMISSNKESENIYKQMLPTFKFL